MSPSIHSLALIVIIMASLIPFTSPAPQSWKPQGRFGKRAAWRPQSRFGKRPVPFSSSLLDGEGTYDAIGDLSAFLPSRSSGRGGPKRAWRPQSRFGKRDDEELLKEGGDDDMVAVDEMDKKAWKPQGRFGKKEYDNMIGGDDSEQLSNSIDGTDNSVDWMIDGNEQEETVKRAWKPQGRFGKRLLRSQRWRTMIEALKRAWKPQGRFGKREAETVDL